MFKQPPNETTVNYEDYQVPISYSEEQDVYDATGMTTAFIEKACSLTSEQLTALINKYIAKSDSKIRRLLGIPITVRKEGHEFFNNPTVQLGPDREDPFEMFGAFDPTDKVSEIYAIYYNEYRTKIPYPKNWDQFTEDTTGWAITNGTMTQDKTDLKCGIASLKSVMTGAGNIQYPSTHNLHKRIYPWWYAGFWFKCSNADANFTFRIVRGTGSYYYSNFNVINADTWEPIQLSIRRFQFANSGGEGVQPDFNWILTYTEYIEITCDRACIFSIDNFNFNDGFFASYPQGTIQWCMPEWYPTGRIAVTYSYDPYAIDVPEALNEASSKMAGILLIDYLIGMRQQHIAFDQMSDTLEESPDRETMQATRVRLQTEAEECLASLGYKSYEGVG